MKYSLSVSLLEGVDLRSKAQKESACLDQMFVTDFKDIKK